MELQLNTFTIYKEKYNDFCERILFILF